MKKFFKFILIALIIFCTLFGIFPESFKNSIGFILHNIKKTNVEEKYSSVDRSKNGIPDCIDLVNTARKEAENKTKYKDGYYQGGYPKDGEGVCTDVIWRAFLGININIKDLVDNDIKKNEGSYNSAQSKPDPNIDFRRVSNLDIFFKRNAVSLTTKLVLGDEGNLANWQPGDIVVILKPYQHIAIVSDKRARDGVPYIIHNTYPNAKESCSLEYMKDIIAGHYRWKY
ncbi:MAG: DUF1287 domain-containing protein [Clostridiaceae bacterium]